MKQTNEPQEVMLDDEIEEEILLDFQEITPGTLIRVGIEDLESGEIEWFFKPFIKWVHDSNGTMYARVEDEHEVFGFRDYRLFDYETMKQVNQDEEVEKTAMSQVKEDISNLIKDYVTETIALDRMTFKDEIDPTLDKDMFDEMIEKVIRIVKHLVD